MLISLLSSMWTTTSFYHYCYYYYLLCCYCHNLWCMQATLWGLRRLVFTQYWHVCIARILAIPWLSVPVFNLNGLIEFFFFLIWFGIARVWWRTPDVWKSKFFFFFFNSISSKSVPLSHKDFLPSKNGQNCDGSIIGLLMWTFWPIFFLTLPPLPVCFPFYFFW